MLGDVGQGLGDHEVGGDLCRLRGSFVELNVHRSGHRGAVRQRGDRRVEAPVGEYRRVEAADEVPDLRQGALGLLVRLPHELRRSRRLGIAGGGAARAVLQFLPGHTQRHC